MTQIYLIRHAEAEGNLYRRAHGLYDGHVTPKGERQIAALSRRFADIPIDVVYSSDKKRTMRTAQAITKPHNLPLHVTEQLREIGVGIWEDKPWGNLTLEDPENMYNFNHAPDLWSVPGGEAFSHVRQRMADAILSIAQKHVGQTVACVSHGMAIRTLLAHLQGLSGEAFVRFPHGDNTSVSLIQTQKEHIADLSDLQVVFVHDASHLTEAESTFARQSWWRQNGESDVGNLCYTQLSMPDGLTDYLHIYAKAWQEIHGDLSRFHESYYRSLCQNHLVFTGTDGTTPIGLVGLNPKQGADDGVGWISMCYVERPYRRRLYGVQFLGCAVSYYRSIGRERLGLVVSEDNSAALAFYKANGFTITGQNIGSYGLLYVLEKAL